MNIGFKIALTGTPVENRLADLVHCRRCKPRLSRRSEDLQPTNLNGNKTGSVEPVAYVVGTSDRRPAAGHAPPASPRSAARSAADRTQKTPERCPLVQAAAYASAIAQARAGSRGDALAALQRLRGASLHPQPDADSRTMPLSRRPPGLSRLLARLTESRNNGNGRCCFSMTWRSRPGWPALSNGDTGYLAAPMVING